MENYETQCRTCGAIKKHATIGFTGKLVGFHGTLIFEDPKNPDQWEYANHTNSPLMMPELKSLIKKCEKKPVQVITTYDGGFVRVEPIK